MSDAPARWLTVTVPGGPADVGDLQVAIAPLRRALDDAGLAASDVVHLKFWTAAVADANAVSTSWAQLFPDAEQRPCVSVIPSSLDEGTAVEITVAAVPGAEVRSVRDAGSARAVFPAAATAGGHLFVGALVAQSSDGDVAGQAGAVFARLQALLDEAGASPDGVGHLFVWYQDHSVRDVINDPFLAMFTTPGDRPARHSVVRELLPGTALMIEAAGSVGAVRSCYTIGGLWHGGIGGVPNSLPFGTRCGDTVFSAGTYGRDPSDGQIPDAVADQTRWALHYSTEFLRVAGLTEADVGQIYVWVRNHADAGEARKAVESVFDADATSIQVIQSALPGTNQIQVELVAEHPAPDRQR